MRSSGAEPSALVVADLLWIVKGELTIQDAIAATHAHIAGGDLCDATRRGARIPRDTDRA